MDPPRRPRRGSSHVAEPGAQGVDRRLAHHRDGRSHVELGARRDLIDEHPEAYKDIDTVMANQADLVAIEHTLSQIFNYKG